VARKLTDMVVVESVSGVRSTSKVQKCKNILKVGHYLCALSTTPFSPEYITMSDREGHSGGIPGADDDLSLPKATVTKMIAGKVKPLHFSAFLSHHLRQRRIAAQ
jgi:hypothetical protein